MDLDASFRNDLHPITLSTARTQSDLFAGADDLRLGGDEAEGGPVII